METSRLYRIEVAPLVILPTNRSPFFSYASREKIAPGSLVSVPFGSRSIEGVAYDAKPLPGPEPHWMKRVSAVKIPSFLTAEQRELARFVSQEYLTPLGKVLRHFVPQQTKRVRPLRKRKTGKGAASPKSLPREILRASQEERAALQALSRIPSAQPSFLDMRLLERPIRMLLLWAKKRSLRTGQVLFLAPEIPLITEWYRAALRFFPPEEVALLHSQITPAQYFEAWERIREGRARFILATRQGLFAPFKKLSGIVCLEEQDESYKQWDMSPRYQAKRVAKALSVFAKAPLLYATGTPSSDLWLSLEEGSVAAALPASVDEQPVGKRIEIVNLRLERFRKNYSPLSESLTAALRHTLREGKQALLYIHRQGMSSFSLCESCKSIFRCPESGHPLTDTPEGHYRCLGCSYQSPLFPSCPECGHLQFRHIGFGTERIEKEVKKLIPEAGVWRADGSTLRKAGAMEDLFQAAAGPLDILIGTQMVLKSPSLPRLGLIAIIDADSLLSWPDYNADERLCQYLDHLGQRLHRSGQLLVQTFQPESPFFQRLATLTRPEFYAHMLGEREALFYPPYARFISLTCQDKSAEDLEKRMAGIYGSLVKAEPGETLRIGLPSEPRPLKRQHLFESSLLLRLPRDDVPSPGLLSALSVAQKSCIIDIDPLSYH